MVRVLEKFEDSFPELDDTRDGGVFKGTIKAMFNDVIRAQRDELTDYQIEYRPMRLTHDNKLSLTRTLMSTVQRIEFGFAGEFDTPYMKIVADAQRASVLEAVRAEFEVGVVWVEEDVAALSIVGVDTCVDSVLPRMDKYRLHPDVRPHYVQWRKKLVGMYTDLES
jgi:hypothetical protein